MQRKTQRSGGMVRLSASCKDLLEVLQADYPSETHGEIVERGLRLLAGKPQDEPAIFNLPDPSDLLGTAKLIASLEHNLRVRSEQIATARLFDVQDQKAARVAIDEMRKEVAEFIGLRRQIKLRYLEQTQLTARDHMQFAKLVVFLKKQHTKYAEAAENVRKSSCPDRVRAGDMYAEMSGMFNLSAVMIVKLLGLQSVPPTTPPTTPTPLYDQVGTPQ